MRPLALLLVLALASCDATTATETTREETTTTGTAFDPAELVLYESSAHGFAIAHPGDWTVTEVAAENLVGFTAPASSGGLTPNFNVTVNQVSEDLPAAAYYAGEIERVETSLENAEFLEVADVNVDGVMGRGLTLVTRQNEIDIGISRVIVLAHGRAYEVSFFAEAAELERLAPLVSSIFQSFRFLP